MSTNVVVRRAPQSVIIYPQSLGVGTVTEIDGLLMGENGTLKRAVPDIDYLRAAAMEIGTAELQLADGVQASGQITWHRLKAMYVALFDITIAAVPTSPVQLTLTGLPVVTSTGVAHGGAVVISEQTTSTSIVCGRAERLQNEEIVRFFADQRQTPLTTSTARVGSRIVGAVIYC